MNEGNIITKQRGKEGDRVLLCIIAEMDKDTVASRSKRRRASPQSTTEAREEITHFYVFSQDE